MSTFWYPKCEKSATKRWKTGFISENRQFFKAIEFYMGPTIWDFCTKRSTFSKSASPRKIILRTPLSIAHFLYIFLYTGFRL
jgi:hypothetical protein